MSPRAVVVLLTRLENDECVQSFPRHLVSHLTCSRADGYAGTGDELLSALTYLHRHISTITAATSMSAPSDACGGSGGGGNEGARGAMSFLETLHGIIDVIQTNRLAELRRCAPSHGTAPEGDTKEMGDAGNGACASGATPGFSHLQDSFKALKKLLNVREEGDKVGITRACAAMESIRTELRSRGLGKRKAKDVDDVAMTEATSDAAAQGSGRDELNALVKRSDMSASDLEKLRKIDTMLRRDYSIRREMLVRRLGVTLQSFLWSKRIKGTEKVRRDLEARPLVSCMGIALDDGDVGDSALTVLGSFFPLSPPLPSITNPRTHSGGEPRGSGAAHARRAQYVTSERPAGVRVHVRGGPGGRHERPHRDSWPV